MANLAMLYMTPPQSADSSLVTHASASSNTTPTGSKDKEPSSTSSSSSSRTAHALKRMSSSSSVLTSAPSFCSYATTPPWPNQVDLTALYKSERQQLEQLVRDSRDNSTWSLESQKDQVQIFTHCKNKERGEFRMRVITTLANSHQSVANVLECLRASHNGVFRGFMKYLHPKSLVDCEVLHTDAMDATEDNFVNASSASSPLVGASANVSPRNESLTLKWLALSTGKALGKPKQFCYREYCALVKTSDCPQEIGVCSFQQYDGHGVRHHIRTKPDAFHTTFFEPGSCFVIEPVGDDNDSIRITLTFAMRKAANVRDSVASSTSTSSSSAQSSSKSGLSSGVKMLSVRFAQDMMHLPKAVRRMMFCSSNNVVARTDWVQDTERSNCKLCGQAFGMLKRRHHCRVCGEVVCSACTVFKILSSSTQQEAGKVRVCCSCLDQSKVSSPQANGSSDKRESGGNSSFTGQPSTTMTASTISSEDSFADDFEDSYPSEAHTIKTSLGKFSSHSPNFRNGLGGADARSTVSSTCSSSSSVSNRSCDLGNSSSSQQHQRKYRKKPSSSSSSSSKSSSSGPVRVGYFNEDFDEICLLAMQALNCPIGGIRTEDFQLVKYLSGSRGSLPRSLPTFRRIASRGRPCIVLDVSSDKRISGEKRFAAKLQFFIGIPLMLDNEVIGDLCVADTQARDTIDYKQIEVLQVLGETITRYMESVEYREDVQVLKREIGEEPSSSSPEKSAVSGCSEPLSPLQAKEVAF